MYRARQRSVAAFAAFVAFVCALAWPSAAAAFHAGNVFDKPPGAGGGGGIFYAGTAREKGWNCTACHRDVAGTIKVTLASDPPELLQAFRYEPGKTYALEAKLEGEHVGAGPSNFNGLTVVIVGANGAPAGEITGYAADEFYSGGPTTIVSAGQRPGENRWTFRWTAPTDASAGAVRVHLAAVDGNGANGEGGGTLTDPFGDDCFVGTLVLDPPSTSERRRRPEGMGMLAFGLALVVSLGLRRGGRR